MAPGGGEMEEWHLEPTISLMFNWSNKYVTNRSGILYFMVVDGWGP